MTTHEQALEAAFMEALWAGWQSGLAGEQMDDDYAHKTWLASDASRTPPSLTDGDREAIERARADANWNTADYFSALLTQHGIAFEWPESARRTPPIPEPGQASDPDLETGCADDRTPGTSDDWRAVLATARDAEVERLRRALEDVVNPLGYLKRCADERGHVLNGQAYTIAHDLNFVRKIAQDALKETPNG